MKNILKTLSISIILFVAISCNEDEFLQENPKDKVYVTLYSSYSGFKVGLNGLYALVRDQYQGYWEQLFMVSTDNAWVSTAGSGELAPFRNYSDLAPAMAKKNLPGSVMTWLYQVINASNVIISRAQNPGVNWEGGSDAINEANKNFVIAQARLLRAYAYRFLTNGWGDIPLVLDEPEGPRDDWSRTPVADVRQAMEEDFLFAVNHLPMKDVQGIPNAAVACHYLLELYLTIGYAKKDNSFYVKAETMADNVINSGKYSLLTNFSDNFKKDVNGGNTECLWFTNNAYSDVIGSFGGENKKAWHSYPDKIIKNKEPYTLYFYNGGRGQLRIAVSDSAWRWYEANDFRFSKEMVKKFYIYPKNPARPLTLTNWAPAEFDTVFYTNVSFFTNSKANWDDAISGNLAYSLPYTRKWEYVDPLVLANSSSTSSLQGIPSLRLADTYLLRAEARFRNGNISGAASDLNVVRKRSSASLISASAVDMDFILDERSRELLCEEQRRITLLRTGTFYERTSKYNPQMRGINAYRLLKMRPVAEGGTGGLFPIPQVFIDANTAAVLPQNPGY